MLDKVRVKGKKLGVAIYEAICKLSEASPELIKELEQYHKALELYFQQKWDEAYVIINELHEKNPSVKVYHLYVDRIKEFKLHPPAADWDGVYIHTSK
jgi:adenylate cyclase